MIVLIGLMCFMIEVFGKVVIGDNLFDEKDCELVFNVCYFLFNFGGVIGLLIGIIFVFVYL